MTQWPAVGSCRYCYAISNSRRTRAHQPEVTTGRSLGRDVGNSGASCRHWQRCSTSTSRRALERSKCSAACLQVLYVIHVKDFPVLDIPADSDHDEKTPPAASPYEKHTPEGYISPASRSAPLPLRWCGEAEVNSAGEIPDSVYAFEHGMSLFLHP